MGLIEDTPLTELAEMNVGAAAWLAGKAGYNEPRAIAEMALHFEGNGFHIDEITSMYLDVFALFQAGAIKLPALGPMFDSYGRPLEDIYIAAAWVLKYPETLSTIAPQLAVAFGRYKNFLELTACLPRSRWGERLAVEAGNWPSINAAMN